MRGLKLLSCFAAAVLFFSTLFSGSSINLEAAASDIVYRQLSVADSYAFYGDTLSITYYSQTGYKNATLYKQRDSLSYVRAGSEMVGTNIPSWVSSTTLQYCQYEVQLSDYSFDPQYLGVSISPNVHFTDCNGLRFCAAAYIGNNTVSDAAYDASFISVFGQSELRFENAMYVDNSTFPYWRIGRSTGVTGNRVLPVWCDYQSDTLSDVNLLRIGFNGARLNNGYITIYLSCPLVNDTAVSGTGIVTGSTPATTTVTGSGDITVNVDMDETNGLLDSILDVLGGIGDMLLGLFVPSQEDLEAWCDDMNDLLHDHLGGMYEAVELIDDTYDGYGSVTAVSSFHVDACNIPLAGSTLTLGNWDVPLKTEALPTAFYDALAYIIDFLAVAAFVNMLRRKLEIVLNPDSEVVETDG